MTTKRKKLLFAAAAAVVILATVLTGTLAFAKSAGTPADATAGRTVSVNGSAQITLKPDIAYIIFGTLTQDASASAALDANNKLMSKVYDALKAQGVDTDKDVKTSNYSINPSYDTNGTKVTGYQINNNIQVTVRDLDKLGSIMEAATAAGANMANGLSFDVENKEDTYNKALAQAIDNARARAETLAKSANATLGTVVSATESGGYNPWPVYSRGDMMSNGAGSVPVSSGTLQVSASVSVTFELK